MLGTLDLQHRQVTIVGAGISGLLLAERLDRAGWEVTLLESSRRAGGLIETRMADPGIAEAAAHSLLATPPVLDLCSHLGVELIPVRRESRARYIWRSGRLRKFPLSLGETLRTLARAYFVLSDPRQDPSGQSLEQWCRRHLGETALKYLLTPFVRGIYGCRPAELQVGLAFPSLVVPRGHSLFSWMFRRWHRKLRGLEPGARRRGRARMMAPRDGMGALTGALERRLRERLGQRFRMGTAVTELPADTKNLVLCVPAPEAARLLSRADAALSAALTQVQYTPLVTITAFAERLAFPMAPRGVGVLLPEGTSRRSLGVLFNSSSFPMRVKDESRWVSVTLMMGGTSRPELAAPSISDQELGNHARKDLEELLGLAPAARVETVIRRWPHAVPQYGDGLKAAWDAARAGWCAVPGRVLFGNYTGQVSIRGMIESTEQIVRS
jgi:oxygen-dependent protoporphyrinogen oxidase